MSGHNKWSTIKHKKGKADARRGKIFSKLIKELTVAARMGGDPEMNPRLRQAISLSKAANMPNDNIDRAIKKGAGGTEGAQYEEISFDGYGPAGVAVLVEAMTDNRNRTVADVRHIFDKYNGKLGEAGCVSWMFEKRGLIILEKQICDEDTVMEVALDAGADDITDSGDVWEILTSLVEFENVKKGFDDKGIAYITAELSMIPQTTIDLSGKDVQKMLKLMDMLEDSDDVQHVYANFDISEEEMEKLSA